MKRLLVSICLCVMVFLSLIPSRSAQAQPLQVRQPLIAISFFGLGGKTITPDDEDAIYNKLKNDFFPAVEKVLTPEQRTLFKTALEEKGSIRSAFKKVPLTSVQKGQLSVIFKSMPKDQILADLSPTQRKQLFLKKKELFKPTLEEITEKIPQEKREFVDKFFGSKEAK